MELNKPITIILLVILTAVLVFLFVLPQYQVMREKQTGLSGKQALYNGQNIYYANIAKLIAGIEQRKEPLEKVSSSLPGELALAPLVYFFQEKAQETGSSVKSIVFLDSSPATDVAAKTGKKVRSVSFSINLLGNYQSLKGFLLALEKSSRMFEVSTISFASPKDQQNPALSPGQSYDFKLQVKTYTY